ncbi:t(6)A37 threonylcarbamoyladenosine biosynthesis protein [Kiritimatiella glycovorans]|uniref:tRNA N6-adenosine threonylcarbamoyltransferase n=2 Tax=Kiritimatiella glycovorans TaxID=1307763 RepID=A0A0G3ECM2_9BACT|nr:tRNA (adenosine(37)-N6)-threonylcarbamoyltransferase complex transferase subunit TsaD [Kiritimatiella glycovorans]AKJ64256.1 t(6)A37 threonylcarbamoyladenosine biosynthesis protein [Kiritimatiella glycovorans]
MRMLAIETSCDETAASVAATGPRILSSAVYSQIDRHRPYGGVVPEIASRDHLRKLPSILEQALRDADCGWGDIDALAVTRGPGLASSLLVGLSAAWGLKLRLGVPLYGVNHLEAHLLSTFLPENAPDPEEACPMLTLLVSGGHTALVRVDGPGAYRVLGRTLDDAAGEALDKGATLMGLGYPGGPAIERAARGGDPHALAFPLGRGGERSQPSGSLDPRLCFSFSGLKTSLLYRLRDDPGLARGDALKDLAASYEYAVCEALALRVERACREPSIRSLACSGGVARNRRLRARLEQIAAEAGRPVCHAPPEYCTDNAAMIAGAALSGIERDAAVRDPQDIDPVLGVE